MTRIEREKQNNYNPCLIGWLCLLVPILGPLVSAYFDYKALCSDHRTAKSLAYAIVIILTYELRHMYLLEFLWIIALCVFIVWSVYQMDACSIPLSFSNFIKFVNNLLDMPSYYTAHKILDIKDVKTEMYHIDELSGDQFELYMVKLLNSVGFKDVRHTPFSNDGGLDAVGYMPDGKTKVGWQFKHYQQGKIGYNAVEQTVSGGLLYDTSQNYLLTNRPYFTIDAKDKMKHINQNMKREYILPVNRRHLMKLVEMNANHIRFTANQDVRKRVMQYD